MSESDHTWNADNEPVVPSEPAAPPVPPAAWSAAWPAPGMPTPPPAPATFEAPTEQTPIDDTLEALPPVPPAPPAGTPNWTAAPPPPVAGTWQPTWPQAEQQPQQPQQPTWPPTSAPGNAAGYGYGGHWGPPPGAGAWPQPPESHQPAGRRVVTIIAALALVLASAGIGAAVAIAVHKNNTSTQNSSGTNNFGNNTNPFGGGSGNSNPFGGGSGNTNPFGGGSGNNGGGSSNTTPSSGGALDANAIASKVDPALVNINTTLSGGDRAAGTGMIITSDGEILTNNHVIADATSISVTIGGTGPTKSAHVVGYDVQDDVALVKVDGVSNLPTITLGDPSGVNVGDPVVAIGNALGKGGTPTAVQGSVTALDQQVTAGDPGGQSETLQGMIQTDAPIQPGDSGGALVNADGKVIGMNTAAAAGRFELQTGTNIGYAIAIDNATTIVHKIEAGNDTGRVHIGARALLGVNVTNASDGDPNGNCSQIAVSSGALVTNVQSNSGASSAGIQSCDVITSVADKSVADSNALHLALTVYHPGDSVKIGWVDANGGHHDANVKLVEGPPA